MMRVIRPSALPSWPDCPRRGAAKLFRRQVVDAGFSLAVSRPSAGAVCGTATHAAVAAMLSARLAGTVQPPKSELEGLVEGTVKTELAEGGDVVWDYHTRTPANAIRQALSMAVAYRVHVYPSVNPVAVEEEMEADLPGGWVMVGHLDAREDGGGRDVKTGRSRRANGAQYGGYILLASANGTPVTRWVEDFIQRVKVGEEQPPPIKQEYHVETAARSAKTIIKAIVRDAEEFARTGRPDVFLANPASMMCSEKFCPAWGTNFCQEHRA